MNLNVAEPVSRLKPLGRLARQNNFEAMETIHRTINEAIAMREHIYILLQMGLGDGVNGHLLDSLRRCDLVIKNANDTRAWLIENEVIFQAAAKRGPYPKERQ